MPLSCFCPLALPILTLQIPTYSKASDADSFEFDSESVDSDADTNSIDSDADAASSDADITK